MSLPDFSNVSLREGIFQIALSLSAADFHALFNGSAEAYVQVEDLSRNVIYPRQKFSAVPYALKVPVDGESITYNANGELALGNGTNTLKLPAAAGALNKVLKSDGTGTLVWADDLSGGGAGTITSTEIQDGTIADADISGTAAIASSKISGLGTLATKNVVGSSEITDGSVTGTDIANGTITDAHINATANISYLKISGLGGAASKNVGTGASDVAAGNHGHSDATTATSGFMSAGDKSKLDGIASGAGVDTNTKTLCADGEYLRGEAATTCRTAAQIVSDASGVKTTDTGVVTSTMILDGTITNTDISDIDSSKVTGLGALATKSAASSADITNDSILDADVNSSAAIAGSKINPDFGSQNVTTTGNMTGATISANSSVQIQSTNANNVSMNAPAALGASYALTMPPDAGVNGQFLGTNGAGTLSWTSVNSGAPASVMELWGSATPAACPTDWTEAELYTFRSGVVASFQRYHSVRVCYIAKACSVMRLKTATCPTGWTEADNASRYFIESNNSLDAVLSTITIRTCFICSP